ncbi:MAG: hypothetical protein ACFFDN_04495, partial [Candidatus Hodarchaeota archaeon]
MCGIFGIISLKNSITFDQSINVFESLAFLSESRGKESAGIALLSYDIGKIATINGPVSISKLLATGEYKSFKRENNSKIEGAKDYAIMGHSRLVTNGSQLQNYNNQPTIKDGLVGIHNGIIVNDVEVWSMNRNIQRKYDVDTELLLSMISYYYKQDRDMISAVRKTVDTVKGTISTAIMSNFSKSFLLFTNNGSIY